MTNTIVKELVVQGKISNSSGGGNTVISNNTGLSVGEKEQIIEECLDRLKEMMRYESER